jgi:hypothetical protein
MNRRSLAAALALLVVVLVLTARPATAHDEAGVLTVVDARPAGENVVAFEVVLTYSGDREPVEGATITVSAERTDVPPVGPIEMTPGDEPGRYRASVAFPSPGTWIVRFSSATPFVTLERTQEVGAGATTGTLEVTTSTTTTSVAGDNADAEDDDDGLGAAGVAAVAAGLAAVLAATVWLMRRGRPTR